MMGSRRPEGPEFDDLLMCFVVSLEYDFVAKTGHIALPEGQRWDMTGCIRKFEKIDCNVLTIVVQSGSRLAHMVYQRQGGRWSAQQPIALDLRSLH